MKPIALIIVLAAANTLSPEAAEPNRLELTPQESRGDGPPRQPPQAAFDACENKDEGDACSVALPDRDDEMEGTCRPFPPQEDTLICAPKHFRPPHGER